MSIIIIYRYKRNKLLEIQIITFKGRTLNFHLLWVTMLVTGVNSMLYAYMKLGFKGCAQFYL